MPESSTIAVTGTSGRRQTSPSIATSARRTKNAVMRRSTTQTTTMRRCRLSSSNLTLYRVLVKLGADEAAAEQAAQLDTAALATKADLAELKAELFKHTTQTLVWMSGI